MLHIFFFFILPLTFLYSSSSSSLPHSLPSGDIINNNVFQLDPTHLDLFFFRAACAALFRAKADTLLAGLPPIERVVHRQCEADADGRLNRLAKCVVALMNQRDFGANSNDTRRDTERPWFSAMIVEKEEERVKMTRGDDEPKSMKIPPKKEEKRTKLDKNMARMRKMLMNDEAEKPEERKRRVLMDSRGGPRRRERRKSADKKWRAEGVREDRDQREKEENDELLKQYTQVRKLYRIEGFYRLVDRCSEYIRRKDEERSEYLRQAQLPFRLATASATRSTLLRLAESQVRGTIRFDKLSILSPKLLSIVPEHDAELLGDHQKSVANFSHNILSPTFFSFHEQGDLSLPQLLKLAFSNGDDEAVAWLDLLLKMSGAASTLDKLLASLGPHFEEIERRIHPAIDGLETAEEQFRAMQRTQSAAQRAEMAEKGYTMLSRGQARMAGVEDGDGDGDGEETREELEHMLEQDIRTIAGMDDEAQQIIADGGGTDEPRKRRRDKRFLRNEPYGQVRMLNPYFFANQIQDGAVLRRVGLSPKAFSSEILSPDFARFDVLSPGAFTPSILSPRAMIAHILSPTAFNARILSPQTQLAEVLNPRALDAKILSPRALAAFVLSPRLLTTEILTPKALEVRVLNPSFLAFNVLSPNMLSLQIASPQNFVMTVLSPNILTAHFLNDGVGNVQILSPQIFSQG